MTNTVFSTIDHLTSRLKLVDSLINTVAARLLPQHEANAAGGCPAGWRYGGTKCINYCRPAGDLLRQKVSVCWYQDYNGPLYHRLCCDCC